MKQLKDILYQIAITERIGATDCPISAVVFDSRKVIEQSVFVAVSGTTVNGHNYIDQAIEQGATAIVCEEVPTLLHDKIVYIKVKNSAEALGYLAANFFDNPSEDIQLIGITGTNGKTTTVTLLHELFVKLGYKVGLLSTVENKIHNEVIPSTHTTPDPIQLNALLKEMLEAGCEYCFMEVSSHAIDQHRITGLKFTGAAFSNITRDHLDYHKTFKAYITAKKAFFDQLPSSSFALYNADDSNGEIMVQNCKAKKYSYALKNVADYKAKVLENQFSGLQLSVDQHEVWTQLVGHFNAYNLLTVYSIAKCLEQETMDVLTVISTLKAVDGRFQYMKSEKGVIGIVDYAHTPDALENVLKTVNSIRTKNEQLITIVGCGGDRDRGKRPLMANSACELSDKVILTSDNPRTENPTVILDDMWKGIEPHQTRKALRVENRNEAIRMAVMLAEENDIIVLAGKGHEKYQDINGNKQPFDDYQILTKTLKELEK